MSLWSPFDMHRSGHSKPGIERAPERGQVLVLMVGGLLAVVILVGLVVDGGNLWAQQRIVQNGADAAAEAGAIVMAERLAGATEPTGGWDARVAGRIAASATANGLTGQVAYYTDICGIPLTSAGTAALNVDGTENLAAAAQVGSGIPTSAAVAPDCPASVVGPPAGVLVLGDKDATTFFASAMGFGTIEVGQRATAVAGYLQGVCDAAQGNECALLPITIPVNVVTCDGQNKPLNTGTPWARHVVYKIPLCGTSPGNVGWLDWFPPAGGVGGDDGLACAIENPNNPPFDLPSWQLVMQAGNVNGGGGTCDGEGLGSVEDEVREYNGQIVYIPMFDVMCGVEPDHDDVELPSFYGCPEDELDGGNGNNLWYRFPSLAYFELCDPSIPECQGSQGAYMQGNNQAECESGGNGATSCLVGQFVDILGSGTVGAGGGGGTTAAKALGVQLIK